MPIRFNSEQHFIQWNDKMARKYDPEAYHLRSHFLIRWIERRRTKTIQDLLNTSQQDTVLEVGCGAGNVLEQLPSNRLHGIDLSTFLIKKSQKRLAYRQARLAQANAERLPFANGQFRALICTEVLEHVRDPRQVIKEMARVATANAVLIISVPNETWINRVKRTIHALGLSRWLLQGSEDSYNSPDNMADEWHLHSFDPTLLKEISKNVLFICQTRAIPFTFVPLRYVVQCQVIEQE